MRVVVRGLDWLVRRQGSHGGWETSEGYPTALTALAGMAIAAEGSTLYQGRYRSELQGAVDYLLSRSRPNGLIGTPEQDDRYTYGHGFAMLFLSQMSGEESDEVTRRAIREALKRAVAFTGNAQTKYGGWGYVSAKDGSDFDEGSTTITQVQGLRGCQLAGLAVPKSIIDRAVMYIHRCSIREGAGGIQYNIYGGGDRAPISAAALASLYEAGGYDDPFAQKLLGYCDRKLSSLETEVTVGYWHYAHYYYSQVRYRQGGVVWEDYRNRLFARLISEVGPDGSWSNGYLGPVLTSAMNLSMLQLENATLPIYQR